VEHGGQNDLLVRRELWNSESAASHNMRNKHETVS
jgi:hypothetical protein